MTTEEEHKDSTVAAAATDATETAEVEEPNNNNNNNNTDNAATSSSSSSDPIWNSWRKEMPTCTEDVQCPEFSLLNSKEHMRAMLAEARQRVCALAKWSGSGSGSAFKLDRIQSAAILLQGGTQSDFEFYDNDTLIANFRQEPFFRYLFGVNEPNAMGILDLEREEVILLVTPMPIASERWLGRRRSFAHYKTEYACAEVGPVQHIRKILKQRNITSLFLMNGVNSDSGLSTKTVPAFERMREEFWVNEQQLHPLLCEARVFKTPAELALLRHACLVTSKGHVHVMRHIQPQMSERQLEALFKGYVYYYGGARHQAYECICGSGNNGSVLHYGHAGYPNDRVLVDGDSVVLDMGGEYMGYATDITCSYPVNGVFSEKQRLMHNAVYAAQQSVFARMKAGVLWSDMHLLAERTIVEHLYTHMHILQYPQKQKQQQPSNANNNNNDTVEAIDYFMQLKVCALFMPHGLGHFLGMTVHDVGGYNDEYPRSEELGLCWLRTMRRLEANMFLTVEPGLYFNECWIRQMLTKHPKIAKCVNEDVLGAYYGMGGCRLEDDVLVTETGIDNFTVCPRSVQEIEAVMKHSQMK